MKNRALLLGPLLVLLFACNDLFGISGKDNKGGALAVSSSGSPGDGGLPSLFSGSVTLPSSSGKPLSASSASMSGAVVGASGFVSGGLVGGPPVQGEASGATSREGGVSPPELPPVSLPEASDAGDADSAPPASSAGSAVTPAKSTSASALPASSATSAASNTCGNGTQEAGEQCDDNNRNDWDGCAADCTLESEWVLTVNGKISPAFDPKTTEYVVNLPLFVESLELTAKAPHAGKVHVAESVLGTDGTWVSPRLVSGETSVELKVMDGTAERKSIRLRVRRSDAEERSIEASDRMARGAFGTSAALSGDGNTVAIGAEGNSDTANQEGAVYLSTRSETTYWFEQQILKASNAQRGDYFGAAVVMSADGKLLAVGAPYEDGSADASGAVYIFELDGVGKWQQRAYLKASNPGRYALFGGGLALSADGSTLAVGASGESGSGTGISDGKNTDTQAYQSGAVYVFSRNAAGSWEQQAYVKAPNAGAGDLFGSSLALNLDGTVLVVGAPGEESSSRGVSEASSANNDALRAGAAYVFTRSMAGVWVHQSYLKASNSDVNDEFGAAVALSSDGSTVAIGAYRESSANRGVSSGSVTSNEAENSGAVYLFENRTSGWAQIAFVKASNAAAGQFFGRALTLSANGSWLVVGAPDEDGSTPGISDGVNTGEYEEATGAAYLFHRKAGVWSQRAYIKSPDPDGYDAFGGAVMLSGDGQTIAICSKYDDGNANTLYASGSVTIVQ